MIFLFVDWLIRRIDDLIEKMQDRVIVQEEKNKIANAEEEHSVNPLAWESERLRKIKERKELSMREAYSLARNKFILWLFISVCCVCVIFRGFNCDYFPENLWCFLEKNMKMIMVILFNSVEPLHSQYIDGFHSQMSLETGGMTIKDMYIIEKLSPAFICSLLTVSTSISIAMLGLIRLSW